MKVLIVVDMQNDFLTGSLANPDACKIVPKIIELAKNYDEIWFTLDSHNSDYLQTAEGKALPIEHCIVGTEGWKLVEQLKSIDAPTHYIQKNTFGSLKLADAIDPFNDLEEVTFCGTCTDICVVSNALILKAMRPNLTINVKADCCAGLSPDKHEAALSVMQSCQINII